MVNKQLKPNSSIIQAIDSGNGTPFSLIPAFIKKYIQSEQNKTELLSILAIAAHKEQDHLNEKLKHITDENARWGKDIYKKIVQLEWSTDERWNLVRKKLIWVAKQIIKSEMGDWVADILKKMDISRSSRVINPDTFNNPHKDIHTTLSTDDQLLVQQEQQARILINALIMWAWHRIFDVTQVEPKYKRALDSIDPSLYQAYYDMVYNNLKYMRETPPSSWSWWNNREINTWSEQLVDKDNDTHIAIQGDIFPVIIHEMAKGVLEYLGYIRYNDIDEHLISSILSVDSRSSEHWMMLLWPQIYKQLLFLIKEAIAEYDEQVGIISSKKNNDYILPLLSRILQLPATDFLSFMQQILDPTVNGATSIQYIKDMLDDINTQYQQYRNNKPTPKKQQHIDDIMQTLKITKQFSEKEKADFTMIYKTINEFLQTAWYTYLKTEKLVKKIWYHMTQNKLQLGSDTSRLETIKDAIDGFRSSRVEIAAFSLIKERQKQYAKWKKNAAGQLINIQPKATQTQLEQAKKDLNPDTLTKIENQIKELINNRSIDDWITDHNTLNTQRSELNTQYLTLDTVAPTCVMQRDNNWWLYELTNIEQLKREAQVMGENCLPDFEKSVQSGNIHIFSLRQGTESRWNIWYRPWDKTINQIKWYIDDTKNAPLTNDNPDKLYVFHALQYLMDTYDIQKINNINDTDLIFTWSDILSPQQYAQKIRDDFPYAFHLPNTKDYLDVDYPDRDVITRINLHNIKKLRCSIQWHTITYTTKDHTITTNIGDDIMHPSILQQLQEIHAIFASIKSNLIQYKRQKYPLFWVQWLPAHEWIIYNDNHTLSLIRWDGEWFVAITDLPYDDISPAPIWLWEQVFVTQKWLLYGLLQRDWDTFIEILDCIYRKTLSETDIVDTKERANGNRMIFAYDMNRKLCIIQQGSNGKRSTICTFPCDNKPDFGNNPYLRSNQSIIKWEHGYGIIALSDDYTITTLLDLIYKNEPIFINDNTAIVQRDSQKGIIKKNTKGIWKEIVSCDYEDINFSAKAQNLWPAYCVVKKNWKYGIIHILDQGYEHTIPCDYKNNTFAFKGKGYGIVTQEENHRTMQYIIQINDHGAAERVLDVSYHSIMFNSPQLNDDEAIVKTADKYGIIQRQKDGIRKEIVPCIHTCFSQEILPYTDEDIVTARKIGPFGAKDIDYIASGNQTMYRKRNLNNIWTEYVINNYEIVDGVDTLLDNEYLVQDRKTKKYGIITKNSQGEYLQTLACIYDDIPQFGVSWFADHEAIATIKSTYKRAKDLIHIISRNKDGIFEHLVSECYEIWSFGATWLTPDCIRIKEFLWRNIYKRTETGALAPILWGSYDTIPDLTHTYPITQSKHWMGVIAKNDDWQRYEIVPYGVKPWWNFQRISTNFPGLWDNEFYAIQSKEKEKPCIIRLTPPWYIYIIDPIYDEIISYDGKCAAVRKWKKEQIISVQEKTTIYKHKPYDIVLQRGTWWLDSCEAVVSRTHNGKPELLLLKAHVGKEETHLFPDYHIKDFGKHGLDDYYAWAKKKWGGIGIIKMIRTSLGIRNEKFDIKEMLPCVYDAIGDFGDKSYSLNNDEAVCMRDGKMGVIKKFKQINDCHFHEVVEPVYYMIWDNKYPLWNNCIWAQRESWDPYTILQWDKNSKTYKDTSIEIQEDEKSYFDGFVFGSNVLPDNVSFILQEWWFDWVAQGLIQKNSDWSYTQIYPANWLSACPSGIGEDFILSKDEKQYFIGNIFADGTIKELSASYDRIYTNTTDQWLLADEIIASKEVHDEDSMFVILKKDSNGIYKEIFSCFWYYWGFYWQLPMKFFTDTTTNERILLTADQSTILLDIFVSDGEKFVCQSKDMATLIQILEENLTIRNFYKEFCEQKNLKEEFLSDYKNIVKKDDSIYNNRSILIKLLWREDDLQERMTAASQKPQNNESDLPF